MKMFKLACTLTTLSLPLSGYVQGAAPEELLGTYCFGCHNTEDWAGSLALDTLDFNHVGIDAQSWEQVIRKLNAGMMPPPGERRPDASEIANFVGTLEKKLDEVVFTPPAAPALHRLNRTEYANAIRDLLDLEIDVSTLLPLDNSSEGFDNVASSLGFSPALIQGYTSAAMKVSQWAIGDMSSTESAVTFRNAPALRQDYYLEGMPFGTRGGMQVSYNFPLDAEYEFNVLGRPSSFGQEQSANFYITLDGTALNPEDPTSFRVTLPAGKHDIRVALLDYKHSAGVNDIYSKYSSAGNISGIDIHGPFNATGKGQTASREKIFSCYPSRDDEAFACAREVLGGLAVKAFRNPQADNNALLEPIMTFFNQGNQDGGFESGIMQGLSRILIDPRFLFRFEEEPVGLPAGESYAISDLELASRLSFFLWSSIPDETLLSLAESNELHKPAVLQQQVARMLADSKASALVDNFAGQWLHLRQLETLTPETDAFNDNLRQAFIQETQLLFSSIIEQDQPVIRLLDANYTYLNEALAKHYGMDNIYGDYFRRVELAEDSPRRGLLGQASFLTITSTASRTSPVIRGSWVLENLLHAPVPAPPPGVETNLDGDGTVTLTSSVRQRLESHRADPSCNACHGVIDPVGFALENFDMIGGWREYDGDSPVDASGTLVDGTPVQSPTDLRNALLSRSDLFLTTFTEKLMTFALGRKVEYYDMPSLRTVLREADSDQYRFSAIVNAIVSSDVFLQRTSSGNSVTGVDNAKDLAFSNERGR